MSTHNFKELQLAKIVLQPGYVKRRNVKTQMENTAEGEIPLVVFLAATAALALTHLVVVVLLLLVVTLQ